MTKSIATSIFLGIKHRITTGLLGVVACTLVSAPLHAAGVLFTFSEVGSDVVATTSGTIASGWSNPGNDTDGFTQNRTFISANSVRAEFPGGVRFDQPSGSSVWSNNNLMSIPGSTTSGVAVGDTFGFYGDYLFYAPVGTNVGDAITPNTTITWSGKTFASLGLDTALSSTPLVLFTLDNGSTISAVLNASAVPGAGLAGLATVGLAGVSRRRRR